MGQAQQKLKKGQYAYSAHSLRITGDIIDVFIGRWEVDEDTRKLLKYPSNADVVGGELMCTIRLRRPIPKLEYPQISHESMRPLVTQDRPDLVEIVLLNAEMVCTHPDGM